MRKPKLQQEVKPVTIVGNPNGSREERRMAKKLERKRNDGKSNVSDPGPEKR